VALAGVVALEAVCLLPADVEPPLRDRLGVGRPVVGAVEARLPALHAREESFERGSVTTAAFPVDPSPWSTIPSLPHPEPVRLFLRWCHISPGSTTSARPAGKGFGASSRANRSIRLITLGIGTPSSLAVRFIDSPLTSSRIALTLTGDGIPRGGVAVKFGPQALQR
jgi:hypothetical protein